MAYAVKEIYYTLQGEGVHAGRPAVFLRFTGCNLWSGRQIDRGTGAGGCARWCDTDFVGTDGPGGGRFADPDALATAVKFLWPSAERGLVVCTGGEPLLQLDTTLVDALHAQNLDVAIETNGTQPVPAGIDWICVSPKAGGALVVTKGDELKLVFPQDGIDPAAFVGMEFSHFLLQPLDDAARDLHTQQAMAYCLAHPRWRLSLQTHKILKIP